MPLRVASYLRLSCLRIVIVCASLCPHGRALERSRSSQCPNLGSETELSFSLGLLLPTSLPKKREANETRRLLACFPTASVAIKLSTETSHVRGDG